ncbi:DUF3800 domain-containing protein [Stenotrophomonas rhizophila]|uniref:DUF3800 domain-containing protein n=1 Tax=Stenotrophomonas rhizophila TaxID=216778 RepID=UPI002A69EDD4|nr:DUF3800 domain-containing protein [Stenotrophomonas rhizophila]MDY0956250.1 DUF3800 domain-containing protein [Stenotrophomonas rhizophila]
MTSIYLDESGHSGDMVNRGTAYDFKGQPYFSLAAVAIEGEPRWHDLIDDLRSRHRVPAGEIKSKSLTSKPRFSADVIHALLDHQAPLFIEVVDKRFFICMCITTFQLLPARLGYRESTKLSFLRNTVADFLYFHSGHDTLDLFVASCMAPGDATLRQSLSSLRSLAQRRSYKGASIQIAQGIAHMVGVVEQDYQDLQATHREPWLEFLPPPDQNKRHKTVWMLPNLTSFTNIYARINRYYGRGLRQIKLIHDQQLELEDILRNGKISAESLGKGTALPFAPSSDYCFDEQAALHFAHSHEERGIQLADVVAGATMRFFRDAQSGAPIAAEIKDALRKLISAGDERRGLGLNQVVPTQHVLNPASF